MSVTINVNNLSLSHKGDKGLSTATIPDVCKTPSPGGPVPIPYPNISFSRDLAKGTTTVKADGGNMCSNYGSEFFKSTGDEAGTVGGVASNTFIKEASWITFSFDVKFEGKGACRLTDKMFHNHQNTVNMSGKLHCPLAVKPVGGGDCQCNSTPTKIEPTCDAPMSTSPNAGCDYYRKRKEDFDARHTCPGCDSHPAPDYYIDYGLKYCEKFSSDLNGKLSPTGKAWLAETRCALQQKLEDGLQADPSLELDSDVFREFAFGTHPSAYLESGFADLPIRDLIEIAKQPELSEYLDAETWKQIIEVGRETGKEWVGDALDAAGQAAADAVQSGIDSAIEAAKDAAKDTVDRIVNGWRFPRL